LVGKLTALTIKFKMQDLAEQLEAVGVPAGPINNLDQVFDDPHVKHRGMKLDLPSAFAKAGTIPGVRTPIVDDGKPMAAERPCPRPPPPPLQRRVTRTKSRFTPLRKPPPPPPASASSRLGSQQCRRHWRA